MYEGMKQITAKEALERMFAGEVVSSPLIKPMFEGNIPSLRKFRIVNGSVYIDCLSMDETMPWEQYHCAINTFLKFDWFVFLFAYWCSVGQETPSECNNFKHTESGSKSGTRKNLTPRNLDS